MQVIGFTRTIIVTIMYCKVNIFALLGELTKKIFPDLIID